MDCVKIGHFLAELRKSKHLTQQQLAEILGVTNKTISRWETGTYMPPVEMLVCLSDYFHVSINELLAGKYLETNEYKEVAEENLKMSLYHQDEKMIQDNIVKTMVIVLIVLLAIIVCILFNQKIGGRL